MLLSEGIYENITKWSKKSMRKECKDGEQMKRMVKWQDPEHLYAVLNDWNLLCKPNTLKIDHVVIFVDEGTQGEGDGDAQYDTEDEKVHSLPLLSRKNPGTFADIDISVENNADWEESIEHCDGE